MFRGTPAHVGVYEGSPFTNVRVKWKFQTGGAIRGTASILDDQLFVGSSDGFLYSLDKHTGAAGWKLQTQGAVYSTPAIADGFLYFTSRDNQLYCVSLRGQLKWKFDLGKPMPAHIWGWDYFLSSPLINGDLVFVGGPDGHLYAVRASDGVLQWKFKTGGVIRGTPALKNGTVYFGSFDSRVYALEAKTGTLRWNFETDGVRYNSKDFGWDRNAIDASAALSDSLLVIGSRDGNVYALSQETGRLAWKFSYGPTWSLCSASIEGSTVYVGWSDNNLFTALDLATGKEKWKYACRHYVYSSPAIVGDAVYFGSHDRNVYCLDKVTGEKRWQFRTDGGILSSPIPDGDLLYIGSDDGYLYALENSDAPVVRKAVFGVRGGSYTQWSIDPRLDPYLHSYGYESLDSAGVENFVRLRIEDRQPSVIVFANNHVPRNWLSDSLNTGLLRKYLDAGGKVVWPGYIPNVYVLDSKGQIIGENVRPAELTFGITYDVSHDWGGYASHVVEEGKKWPLPEWWVSTLSVIEQPGITVLGRNDFNRPSVWVKNYGGKEGTGFVQCRLWEVGRAAKDSDLKAVRLVAEYGF